MWTDLGSQGARTREIDKMGAETGAGDHQHTHRLITLPNFDINVQLYINIHNRLDKAPMKFLEICKVLNH